MYVHVAVQGGFLHAKSAVEHSHKPLTQQSLPLDLVASAFILIALFATRASLSTGKPMKSLVLMIQRVAPALVALSIGAIA